MQPPQLVGAEIFNQRDMLFSNGGNLTHFTSHLLRIGDLRITQFNSTASNSTQKRRREISTAPFPFQQNAQLIDRSQLHYHQGISTGFRLSFSDKYQQQKSLFHTSDEFAAQIKRQREEIDQLVHTKGEQLRETLSKMRRRHYQAVISAAEAAVGRRLGEKEAEAERATRRNAELEAHVAQLTMEAQIWRAKARTHESTTAALQAQLQQAIVSGSGEDRLAAEDADSAYIDPDRTLLAGPSCKACRRQVATVVVLPCRHLSVCIGCDGAIIACPVCFCSRNSSVEVSLS